MVRQYMKLLPEEGFLIDESQREGIQAVLTALTKAPMTSGFQSLYGLPSLPTRLAYRLTAKRRETID